MFFYILTFAFPGVGNTRNGAHPCRTPCILAFGHRTNHLSKSVSDRVVGNPLTRRFLCLHDVHARDTRCLLSVCGIIARTFVESVGHSNSIGFFGGEEKSQVWAQDVV